ncbi:MAG: mechanosensitive ion channel family protein [Eubacteriales bacterium]|nr:mechanosensitive ion channel family protein [Eubacteriales bacterium]
MNGMWMQIATQTVEDVAKQVEESAGLVSKTVNRFVNWLVSKSGSVLIAILVIVIGMKLVNWILKLVKKSLEKSSIEHSVVGFLLSVVRVIGYVLVFLTAASVVGFEITSFVTILGTASLSIGLALQGALSNLAGGVLILMLKPFQVGDYIIENNKGNEGTVTSIDIFYTRLKTYDNKMIVIPNGVLADNSLVNLTAQEMRKVEIKILIAYQSDIQKVKEVVRGVLAQEGRIIESEPIDIFIDAFEDNGMRLGIRCMVQTQDYWSVTWNLKECIKVSFDEQGIVIPYNRLEVELLGEKGKKKGVKEDKIKKK